MNSAFPPQLTHSDWKTLYRAAICESDKSVVCQKVSDAEAAVLARRREMFYSGGSSDEKESLEDALYLLRAYRIAWEQAESKVTDIVDKTAA